MGPVVTDYWGSSGSKADELENKLRQHQKKISSIGERVGMNSTEFDELFDLMLSSDDQMVTDIFEQMLVAGKLLFGEELGQRAIAREQQRIAQVKYEKEKQERRRAAIDKLHEIEDLSDKIIEKRKKLLREMATKIIRYSSIRSSPQKRHIDELIESGHLKVNLFGFLKIRNIERIPTTKFLQGRRAKYDELAYDRFFRF